MEVINEHNYVRADSLSLLSIDFFALVVACLFFGYLLAARRGNLETAFFLALPFSDKVFRVFSVQPVEFIAVLIVITRLPRWKSWVRTPLLGLALLFFAWSFLCFYWDFEDLNWDPAHTNPEYNEWYAVLYACRFALTALVFAILSHERFALPVTVLRFLIPFCFLVTALQALLWIWGFPIDGIFYEGFLPRAKGLAHEPSTWCIWLLSLYPYISYFKLGWRYVALNTATIILTFSTFGVTCLLTYLIILCILDSKRVLKKLPVAAIGIFLFALLILSASSHGSEHLSKGLSVFDKLVYYVEEFAGQPTDGVSGRGGDLEMFAALFPDHWLFGIGCFNAVRLFQNSTAALANTYVVFLVDMGLAGCALVAALLIWHYTLLLRSTRNVYFMAFALNFLVMIAGIRCFGFHELWYAQANAIRLRTSDPKPTVRRRRVSSVDPKPSLSMSSKPRPDTCPAPRL